MSFTADQTASVGTLLSADGNTTVSCSFATLPSANSVIVVGAWMGFSFDGINVAVSDSSGNVYSLARQLQVTKAVNEPLMGIWTTNLGGLSLPGSPPLTISVVLPASGMFGTVTAKSYTSSIGGTLVVDLGAFGSAVSGSAPQPPPIEVISGIPNRSSELFVGVSLKNTLGSDSLTLFGDLNLVGKNENGNAGEIGLMCDLAAVDSNPKFFGMDWANADNADTGALIVPFYIEPYITIEESIRTVAVNRAAYI